MTNNYNFEYLLNCKITEEELVGALTKASEDYYTTGTSFLSDKEFDILFEKLQKEYPNSKFISKREIHSDDWNYKLEILPRKLYSIGKIKTQKEINNWKEFIRKQLNLSCEQIDNEEIVLTPKYDGIKILSLNRNFYTRYETGEQGYNVTARLYSNDIHVPFNCEGELIISKSNFKNYCKGYTSSRNFIPAIFSSKQKLEAQDKVDYICYSLYGKDELDKVKQIEHCNNINKIKVPYVVYKFKDLTEDLIIQFYFENQSDYEYDGVVLDLNRAEYRNCLGETQKYVDYCRAYKGDALFDDVKESSILNINYQISRYGKLTPVAKIEPVVINEGIVKNISLYNCSYVEKENIYIGQKIEVTRKGKINPKIVGFITRDKKAELPKVCPFCGAQLMWDSDHVELYCMGDNCQETNIQKFYFFLKTIGIKDFGLELTKSFVKGGFNSIQDFFDKNKIRNLNIEGVGNITKENFIKQIDLLKENGVRLEILQEASGCFEGISASTFKILNSFNVDIEYLFKDSYYNEIWRKLQELDGIGSITAKTYIDCLPSFWEFYEKIKNFIIIKKDNLKNIEENKDFLEDSNGKNIENSKNLNNIKVVFTGFRDKELQSYIEGNGGKVVNSVSSNTTYVVAKNKNENSGKLTKARELGIKIISIEEFKALIN